MTRNHNTKVTNISLSDNIVDIIGDAAGKILVVKQIPKCQHCKSNMGRFGVFDKMRKQIWCTKCFAIHHKIPLNSTHNAEGQTEIGFTVQIKLKEDLR